MKVLIRQARIICTTSPFHGQVQDIMIVDGIIQKISNKISDNYDQLVEFPNLHVSIGWTDLFANFADPGYEQRETLASGCRAAAMGGFTDVAIIPNTNPAISAKTQVEYILQKAASQPVSVHPIGAVSKNTEGKELAEMYDMYASGATVFSDGLLPVQNPGLLLKALQYVLVKRATILQIPDDRSIGTLGLMNEGVTSTRLGLPGKPALSEELMIARDIELLKYTGSALHITGITTRKGIELISAAKSTGLNLTCSVTPNHLYFCDEDLVGYDTNLKVNPPLRTKEDVKALREAFANGLIDCIASHHNPLHWDDKTCEFEYAKPGMIGLESLFGIANHFASSLESLISQMTITPRKILGLPIPEIREGIAACLTFFDPELEYTFDISMIGSASRNSAFIGKKLKGKPRGIINKGKTVINS
jgi:dihydroorotase